MCTNHYKISALMSLRSCETSRTITLALVVIRARMSDLLSCLPEAAIVAEVRIRLRFMCLCVCLCVNGPEGSVVNYDFINALCG